MACMHVLPVITFGTDVRNVLAGLMDGHFRGKVGKVNLRMYVKVDFISLVNISI